MEEQFGMVVDDDEITGEAFETIGTLHDFVNQHA
jgi:acyl carrier protein